MDIKQSKYRHHSANVCGLTIYSQGPKPYLSLIQGQVKEGFGVFVDYPMYILIR
jgi:hypothetical protein